MNKKKLIVPTLLFATALIGLTGCKSANSDGIGVNKFYASETIFNEGDTPKLKIDLTNKKNLVIKSFDITNISNNTQTKESYVEGDFDISTGNKLITFDTKTFSKDIHTYELTSIWYQTKEGEIKELKVEGKKCPIKYQRAGEVIKVNNVWLQKEVNVYKNDESDNIYYGDTAYLFFTSDELKEKIKNNNLILRDLQVNFLFKDDTTSSNTYTITQKGEGKYYVEITFGKDLKEIKGLEVANVSFYNSKYELENCNLQYSMKDLSLKVQDISLLKAQVLTKQGTELAQKNLYGDKVLFNDKEYQLRVRFRDNEYQEGISSNIDFYSCKINEQTITNQDIIDFVKVGLQEYEIRLVIKFNETQALNSISVSEVKLFRDNSPATLQGADVIEYENDDVFFYDKEITSSTDFEKIFETSNTKKYLLTSNITLGKDITSIFNMKGVIDLNGHTLTLGTRKFTGYLDGTLCNGEINAQNYTNTMFTGIDEDALLSNIKISGTYNNFTLASGIKGKVLDVEVNGTMTITNKNTGLLTALEGSEVKRVVVNGDIEFTLQENPNNDVVFYLIKNENLDNENVGNCVFTPKTMKSYNSGYYYRLVLSNTYLKNVINFNAFSDENRNNRSNIQTITDSGTNIYKYQTINPDTMQVETYTFISLEAGMENKEYTYIYVDDGASTTDFAITDNKIYKNKASNYFVCEDSDLLLDETIWQNISFGAENSLFKFSTGKGYKLSFI